MNSFPIEIISNEISPFLDEKSMILFSITNKKHLEIFQMETWSVVRCINLIQFVIKNRFLMSKIKKILFPIKFICTQFEFWPPHLSKLLEINRHFDLLNWMKESGCPPPIRRIYSYSSDYDYDYDYDDLYINDEYYDDDKEDENIILNEYFTKECKKKNKKIDFNKIIDDESFDEISPNEVYDEYSSDDDEYSSDDDDISCYMIQNQKKTTLGDFFPNLRSVN